MYAFKYDYTKTPVVHQDEPTCVLCRKHVKDDENRVSLREKGSKSINATSKQCGDSINTVVGQIVHVDCRRDYVNKKRIESSKRESNDVEHGASKKRMLRSSEQFLLRCSLCVLRQWGHVEKIHERFGRFFGTRQNSSCIPG